MKLKWKIKIKTASCLSQSQQIHTQVLEYRGVPEKVGKP